MKYYTTGKCIVSFSPSLCAQQTGLPQVEEQEELEEARVAVVQ